MTDTRMEADATLWARDAGVYVSLHTPTTSPEAWARYLDGLTATYESWGIGHIVDRERLEPQGCTLFWLIHDRDGTPVGGIRVEGPHDNPEDYSGVQEMAGSTDIDRLGQELTPAINAGLIEFKGAWSHPPTTEATSRPRPRPRIGRVLSRCMQHSLWWLEMPHAFCVSAEHARAGWETAGARPVETVSAAPYPDNRYRSIVLLWGDGHHRRVDAGQRVMIEAERRYLTPARDQEWGGWWQWHPEILLDLSHDRLAQIRASGVTEIDLVAGCQAELDELVPPAPDDLWSEPAHWVHLPWRRLLLHLPGPDTYWRLRVDRDRYKLTDQELAALRQRTAGVVGLSVGSSAAWVLAQEGLVGHLRLADHDVLELTNLNRLSASMADLGQPKTHLTARRLAELDPYLPVTLYDEGVTADNVDGFITGLDVVVEECDSIDIKVLVRRHARHHRVPVVMETSDRGLLDVERFDLEPDREPFHGLVGDLDPAELAGLSTDDKVPHVLAILEADELSPIMAASMVEIDQTTTTWPQLASDVALGACLVAATVRRLFTQGDQLTSGRARLDLDQVLDQLTSPAPLRPPVLAAPVAHEPLPAEFEGAMVAAAGLAPSGGNMQPWVFEPSPGAFDVIISPYAPVGMDIGRRGSAVACGAALLNAAIVAAAHGRLDSVDLRFHLDEPDLAGRVLLGQGTDPDLAALVDLIPQRISNRHYGPPTPLTPDQVDLLDQAARAGGGRLCYVPPAELDELTDLWADDAQARMLSPRLHREMMNELRRPGIDSLTEGIDERTFEFSPADQAKLPILRRPDVMAELERLDGGVRLGDDTRKRFRASSGLAVVVTDGTSQADYVRGGIALQRLWLAAAQAGIGLHPMSPMFGYAHNEGELAEIIRPDRAQDLFARSRLAWRTLGIEPGESFVLGSRVVCGPSPTAISQRRRPRPLTLAGARSRTGIVTAT